MFALKFAIFTEIRLRDTCGIVLRQLTKQPISQSAKGSDIISCCAALLSLKLSLVASSEERLY